MQIHLFVLLSKLSPTFITLILQSSKIESYICKDRYQQIYIGMDINSANFDAKRYVLFMLKDNSVKQLIRRNNEIDEQIKTHDHEIQSLVFENYSKFISSIDTVRQMKNNICMVDEKLKILEKSMDNISELAYKIDSTFAVKRKQIQKLDTINKDLQKLKNLCEFPNVLKQDINYYKGLSQSKITSEIQTLFNKSVQSYQACYKTLLQLKDEPLIAPIFKDSIDKVQTMRSTLKALQVQYNKNKSHSSILRNITRKLLLITDDQVSILRIYLHSWKERFGEACFRGPKKNNLGLVVGQNGKKLLTELLSCDAPQINEELWKEFEAEFNFIYRQVYPKLTISPEEIQLHIAANMRQIFSWAINHYVDAVPSYCTSLRGYVQTNHFICLIMNNALSSLQVILKEDSKQSIKLYAQLKSKMQEKFQHLGLTMLHFVFGRLKLYFLLQVIQAKKECETIRVSQENIKDCYVKGLTPLKDNLNSNVKLIIDELEHLKNSFANIFRSEAKYEESIIKQVEQLIKYLAVVISKPSTLISEQICWSINKDYSHKLAKNEKALIEATVKELIETNSSGGWHLVANNYLHNLVHNLGRKIIDNIQKSIQITKQHDYSSVFLFCKAAYSQNLVCMCDFFARKALSAGQFQSMLQPTQDFIQLLNIIFAQSKQGLFKKPCFLYQENGTVHQTQILSVKKMPLLNQKNSNQRSQLVAYFVRKILKTLLMRLRKKSTKLSEYDIYCIVQLFYEMSTVQEESQICAFYRLLEQNMVITATKQQLQQKYLEARKALN